MSGPSWRNTSLDLPAACRSCSRSKVPTLGISRSIMYRRRVIRSSLAGPSKACSREAAGATLEPRMSKQIPDTAAANEALTTTRSASRQDHLPYEIRHLDDAEWEKIRWPG